MFEVKLFLVSYGGRELGCVSKEDSELLVYALGLKRSMSRSLMRYLFLNWWRSSVTV